MLYSRTPQKPKKSAGGWFGIGCLGCIGIVVFLILLARGSLYTMTRISPGLEPQSEDYRTARSHFRTHLVRHTGSPQQGEPLQPLPGVELVEYSPGLHLQAWVSPDAGGLGGKRPAVLFLHGGFALGADDWEMTQPYRDAGYVVMTPALRGENGQQGDISLFYDEVTDVLAAADYLVQLPYVDARHLYVAGHSVGGTMTLLTALTSPRFQAATSFSGAPDVRSWSKSWTGYVTFDMSRIQEYQMRSAVAYAGSFQCPTRIYCGSSEIFFLNSSQETSRRAKLKGLDVEAITVPGDHFTAVPEEIRKSIAFFQ